MQKTNLDTWENVTLDTWEGVTLDTWEGVKLDVWEVINEIALEPAKNEQYPVKTKPKVSNKISNIFS
jgi:hypothetical protein